VPGTMKKEPSKVAWVPVPMSLRRKLERIRDREYRVTLANTILALTQEAIAAREAREKQQSEAA